VEGSRPIQGWSGLEGDRCGPGGGGSRGGMASGVGLACPGVARQSRL